MGPAPARMAQAPALDDAHLVHVLALLEVVGGLERPDHAGDRLREGGLEVALAFVGQQAAELHHLGGDDDVRGVARRCSGSCSPGPPARAPATFRAGWMAYFMPGAEARRPRRVRSRRCGRRTRGRR